MKLILVRHGRTLSNVAGALDTSLPGLPLDAVGLEQAGSLPGRLSAAGHLEAIGSLWVSPILRARETIAPIEQATGLVAQVRSGLREVLAGEIDMNTDARSVRCYTDTTRSWMVGRTGARIPGSPEDGAETFERFNGVIEEIEAVTAQADPEASALVVAHGTVLRLWVALATAGVDPAWVAEHPMRNTGITVVDGDPRSGWRLVDWNEGDWSA